MVSDTIEKGDIVWIEYDAWTVTPNGALTLFDTTHDEVAKKEGKFDEKKVYIEAPVVIGRGRLFEGLEAALVGGKVGETIEVLIPPEKGAGVRDPRLVELRTEREFLRQEISPEVGLEVSISGKHGVVTAVSAGRVRVDFNNPLAGKTLKYVVKATRKAQTPEERVRAVIDMDYGLADQFKIDLKGGSAEIHLPDVCKTDEKWFVSKFRVVADLRELSELKTIRFVEEYEKKEAKAVEPKAEAKEAGAPVEAPKEEPAPEVAAKKPRKRATATKAKPTPKHGAEEDLPASEKTPEEL
ncbi:MAG: peptidylprolyl isomerase [Methanobacteriota archaeon]|nr:MAG: peptidylprolyl isomerase [Euryarchaeota archaeon]